MSPKERLDAVKNTLRGMGLHGVVSSIESVFQDTINLIRENGRLRAEDARLREVNKSMEAKIDRQRAAIRSLPGKAGA